MTEKFRGWDELSQRMIYDTEDYFVVPLHYNHADVADFCRFSRFIKYNGEPHYISGYNGEVMRFIMKDKNDKETYVGDYI